MLELKWKVFLQVHFLLIEIKITCWLAKWSCRMSSEQNNCMICTLNCAAPWNLCCNIVKNQELAEPLKRTQRIGQRKLEPICLLQKGSSIAYNLSYMCLQKTTQRL